MIRTAARYISILLVLNAASASSQADERSDAKEHYIKGTKAFDLGAYDEAVSEYSQAYRLHDDPALLYNIAQAHRLAGHTSEAVRFYRMFLVRNPNAPNRDEVEQKISELQKLIDQQKRTQNLPPDQTRPPGSTTPPPQTTPPSTEMTSPASPPTTTTPVAVSALSAESGTRSGRSKKIAGIVVAGVGVAAVVVGATFGGLAAQAGDDLTKLDQNMQTFDPSKQSTGKTDQLLEGVLLGVGGSAIVAGVVVYVLGHREAKASRVAATPLLGPRMAGAALRMSF